MKRERSPPSCLLSRDVYPKGPLEKKLFATFRKQSASTLRASRRTENPFRHQLPKNSWKSQPEQAPLALRNSCRAGLLTIRIRSRSPKRQPHHPEASTRASSKARCPQPRSRRQRHAPRPDSRSGNHRGGVHRCSLAVSAQALGWRPTSRGIMGASMTKRSWGNKDTAVSWAPGRPTVLVGHQELLPKYEATQSTQSLPSLSRRRLAAVDRQASPASRPQWPNRGQISPTYLALQARNLV